MEKLRLKKCSKSLVWSFFSPDQKTKTERTVDRKKSELGAHKYRIEKRPAKLTKLEFKFPKRPDMPKYGTAIVIEKKKKAESAPGRTKKDLFETFDCKKLNRPTLQSFLYGVKLGTLHQGDRNFSSSRNCQGICMPIAAFCFSALKHPDRWTLTDIDNVVNSGNDLFLRKESDDWKYCRFGNRNVGFLLTEPEIPHSDNLCAAINTFFGRYDAMILQFHNLSVAIWKDKHYYFFDAGPRTIDLFRHPNGTALLANFYDTFAILTVLLDRSNIDNPAFKFYSITANKVGNTSSNDSTRIILEIDNRRNKEALTIAVTALVYSEITPMSYWHEGTIEKIVTFGKQLFEDCSKNGPVTVNTLPRSFTIDSYMVQISITEVKFKNEKSSLLHRLESFFEKNSHAILEIDNSTLAVWKWRKIYHCLDPRDGKCRSYFNLKSTLDAVAANSPIFHIHALKILKIKKTSLVDY